MNCSTPGFPVLHYLPEFAQTYVHWMGDVIQPSYPLPPPSPQALNLSQHESFPMSWLLASDGQNIGASASASVLPMNVQGWFPLGLIGLISILSKEISRVFSSTTIRKHQFFSTQTSLWSNSHIYTSTGKTTVLTILNFSSKVRFSAFFYGGPISSRIFQFVVIRVSQFLQQMSWNFD